MQHRTWRGAMLGVVALVVASHAAVALADKPDGVGGGRPDKHPHKERHEAGERRGGGDARERRSDESRGGDADLRGRERDRDSARAGVHFGDRQRSVVREYYEREVRSGNCPPGLAKKGNGCMPPGQAKKWSLGRPLPRDVVYYDLPPAVVVELGVPPVGHKYVRVATDILMIAIGTGMVVDAIEDLGRL